MKTLISYIKEDVNKEDPLKNPSLMHDNYASSVEAARKMSSNQTDIKDRAYIMTNKYYQQQGVKKYIVVYNKSLISLSPNWKQRGYNIIGWVSQADGLVVKNTSGKFVKDNDT